MTMKKIFQHFSKTVFMFEKIWMRSRHLSFLLSSYRTTTNVVSSLFILKLLARKYSQYQLSRKLQFVRKYFHSSHSLLLCLFVNIFFRRFFFLFSFSIWVFEIGHDVFDASTQIQKWKRKKNANCVIANMLQAWIVDIPFHFYFWVYILSYLFLSFFFLSSALG